MLLRAALALLLEAGHEIVLFAGFLGLHLASRWLFAEHYFLRELRFDFRPLRFSLSAIATACFCSLPESMSSRMFSLTTFFDDPLCSGIVLTFLLGIAYAHDTGDCRHENHTFLDRRRLTLGRFWIAHSVAGTHCLSLFLRAGSAISLHPIKLKSFFSLRY